MTTHCNCTLAQRTVGDGCQSCNPKLALELAAERIAELELLADSLMRDVERWCLKASDLEAENARLLAEVARLQHHADAEHGRSHAAVAPCELAVPEGFWLAPNVPNERMLRPFILCPEDELLQGYEAMKMVWKAYQPVSAGTYSHGTTPQSSPPVPGV